MDGRVELQKGTLLDGTYRIERTIGAGGFGITYEAQDVGLSTRVAVKEYYPEEFGDRDSALSVRPKSERHKTTFDWGRSSFLEEARTLARFRHPSIVRVSRVFERNSTAYMVMDFEPGQNLESWLSALGRPPTQEELDRIAAPLLDALDMMHAEQFLHRDIAPDNIIVRANGSPVLLDFGAARRAVAEKTRTLTGVVKAGYSPQEQYATDGRLQGPWSDLYAFGATLYRAVAGTAPDEATLRETDDPARSAMKVARASYRPEFLLAIDHCLKIRRTERPQTVAELRPMLLSSTRATRPIPQPEMRPPKPAARRSPKADPPRPPSSGNGALKWLVAAAALAVLGGAYGGFEFARHGWTLPDDAPRRQADAERQRASEAKRLADAEAARRKVEEEKVRAEAEARRRAQEKVEEERQREAARQAEAQRKAREEEAQARAEAEARRRREEQAEAERRAEEARRRAEEEKRRAEQEERNRRRQLEPAARAFNPSARPSFDCATYSRTPLTSPSRIPQSEVLCLDVDAADADRDMGDAFRRKPESARTGQLQWIVWRNSQCPATWADVHDDARVRQIGACLAEASRNRTRELNR